VSKPTTYDLNREQQIVPYVEPPTVHVATTHDLISARLIVEAAPNNIGDRQVMGGVEYVFDGETWQPVEGI
jgi:hypothetical protein